MNSLELKKQITHLKQVKKRNEDNVPQEELMGKYREPYEKLCENLKLSQAELRKRYTEFLRQMVEILSDAVYADPEEEYQRMHDRFCEIDERNGGDPFFRKIMEAVFFFGDGEEGK